MYQADALGQAATQRQALEHNTFVDEEDGQQEPHRQPEGYPAEEQ